MKRNILLVILNAVLLGTVAHASGSLDPARKELPAEQNAYAVWTNAIPEIKLPDDQALWDAYMLACNLSTNMPVGEARKQLDAWLASKKRPLALLAKSIALGRLQLPAFGVEDFIKFDLSGLRHTARVKVVLAREHAERAEYAESVREFTEVFKMGQLIAAGDGPIVNYLVGIAVQSMGLSGIRWLISKDEVSPDVLRRIQNDLPVPHAEDPVLAQVYRVEYAQFTIPVIRKFEMHALEPTNNFPVRISRVLDVTNTIVLAEAFYCRFVTNALAPWPNRDTHIEVDANALLTLKGITNRDDFIWSLTMSPKEDSEARKKWKKLEKLGRKQPNIFGKLLLATMIIPTESMIHERSVKIRTEINLTRVLAALQSFRKTAGKWPESLEAVQFKSFLPDQPIDLFTGKSVLYSREKGILWSAGPDGIDDGGDAEKDFVIKLPNPVAGPD